MSAGNAIHLSGALGKGDIKSEGSFAGLTVGGHQVPMLGVKKTSISTEGLGPRNSEGLTSMGNAPWYVLDFLISHLTSKRPYSSMTCLQATATLPAAGRELPFSSVRVRGRTPIQRMTDMSSCPTSPIRKNSTLVHWTECNFKVFRTSAAKPSSHLSTTLWLPTFFSCFGLEQLNGPRGRAQMVVPQDGGDVCCTSSRLCEPPV